MGLEEAFECFKNFCTAKPDSDEKDWEEVGDKGKPAFLRTAVDA
jgi:hypothetical protein